MNDLYPFNPMENLTLVSQVAELKTLERHLKTINERVEDIAHKISDKIETAETLISQNFDAYTLLNSEERTTVNTIILEALSRNNYNLDSIDYEIKTTVVD